ncbi:hypothetical protein ACWDPV_07935 [Gordonia sp. NPDC003504]|jgi:hypothetical protein
MIIVVDAEGLTLHDPHDYTCLRVGDGAAGSSDTRMGLRRRAFGRVDDGGRVRINTRALAAELRGVHAFSGRWFPVLLACATLWGWERCGDELVGAAGDVEVSALAAPR